MKTIFIISFLLFFVNGHGQIFNTDPFKIDNFLYYHVPLNKTEVLANKIKKVSSITYGFKKNGNRDKKGSLNYYIEFNNQGNPTHYYEKIYSSLWWWPDLLQTLHLQKESSEEYDYLFNYDSLQKLIHIQEIIINNACPESKAINDVYNIYSGNLLTTQTISEKTLYKPGVKYRGVSYPNDTNITDNVLFYDSLNNVTSILISRYKGDGYDHTSRHDTIKINCPFDSLFRQKKLEDGEKADSLGRIVERIYILNHATSIGGHIISIESPYDRVIKYFYDKNGYLNSSEEYTRKGDFIEKISYYYDSNGLPLSNRYENLQIIICFEYEFY